MDIEEILNTVIQGNCLDIIRQLPDKSINCVITSPPYWQLRDYKWDGQWGLEPTFQMYLENLWSLMDEIYRVLKDDGTVWVNLGDTYTGGGGGNYGSGMSVSDSSSKHVNGGRNAKGISSKCLLLIPHRFGIGCIDRGWIMRNDIVWAKRNGMPESVRDRFTKKHEFFFLMTKSEKYYFDLDSIRDKQSAATISRFDYGWNGNNERGYINGPQNNMTKFMGNEEKKKDALSKGKNPGNISIFWDGYQEERAEEYIQRCIDYWNNPDDLFDVTTKGSSDEHFAAYNEELVLKPIFGGCPEGGIILDPFAGTATTGCVAINHKRKFIGIEGSEKYVKMANKNLKPFKQKQFIF